MQSKSMQKKKYPLIVTMIIFLLCSITYAGEPLSFTKEFNLFTSQQAQGYFKPLFTSIEQSLNSNLHTTALYQDKWTIGIDISTQGMLIPDAQKTYDAALPELYGNTAECQNAELRDGEINRNFGGYSSQPTIYGGTSNPIFSAPQYDTHPSKHLKSVGFAEGMGISSMPGVPVLQLIFGFPTRTEFRFRFLTFPVQGENFNYFGFILNQRFDHFFDIFGDDTTMALAANLSFHIGNRDPGIEMNSYSFGLHWSKYFEDVLSVYAAFQYENMGGEFQAERKDFIESDFIDSPYEEVRNGEDIIFDLETFTNFRFYGGISRRFSFLELNMNLGYASQPFISGGITFWIAEINK
jgi:hypothetical protein